jgi:hypothetical protein
VAHEEQLAVLERGAAAWNDWRDAAKDVEISLTDSNFTGVDLGGVNLSYANLKGSDFSNAMLDGAILDGADLSRAVLDSADLREASLISANLSSASLAEANFSNACLRDAVLSDTYLYRTNFNAADLCGADLSGRRLLHTNFTRANLADANFTLAHLGDTLFVLTDLSTTRDLETRWHDGRSAIDFHTIMQSGSLTTGFLRGCGLPETVIEYLPSMLNRPIEFYSCFISYSHVNQAFARRLHDGANSWASTHCSRMRPGSNDHVHRGGLRYLPRQ